MSILPLPQFEADLREYQDERERLSRPPETVVVRYSKMRRIAELPYSGSEWVGCGSKLVIRTARGTEIAEMLTTVCSNGGC
ncbi:MAG TPA: hypothetical protein ENJ06_03210, partial [Phycisphaeraceae bacterium]|nr:hypothetical protein [Phycisphaeraceae bacterium]